MKIHLLALATIVCTTFIKAQSPCATGRYATDTFTNTTVTSNITYGSNITVGGSAQALTMDVYEPTGDVDTKRPLIILAHGGSFVGGSKTDADMVALSQAFSKKGYVCASINYRLGFFPFDSVNAVRAVVRALQDMKASIRFFYKDKLTSDTYKIDTNNIFIGGSSAGAITALHAAYLNKSCEIVPYIGAASYTALGGIEGYSGNQCYSSKIKGVISICGALGKYGWLEAGDVPFCTLHGTIDGTVKYSQGKASPSGQPLLYLDGSRMLKQQAMALGINNPFYTWYGADHVPYQSNALYMDTTINFVRDFLISRLGCTNTALQAPNTPFGTATLYPYTPCTTNSVLACSTVGIKEFAKNLLVTNVFPNPSDNEITVEFKNQNSIHYIELLDLTGKQLFNTSTNDASIKIKKNSFNAGMYFLKITDTVGNSYVQKVIFK